MEGLVKGDVVILDFPFADLAQRKRRPALVLQVLQKDIITLQITTSNFNGIILEQDDFITGELRAASIIRPNFIMTVEKTLVLYKAGHITTEKLEETIESVCALVRQ
ncbi:type II toxin-antitoxin system PemK/MazF family toxin [Candidatus Woesearchaeota archaeon]|nr:type II toxin-antitoxin system PemK/MazF family toxin [Candidatus Woesearchaeota archaeon]